jgi:hypothetical protein
MAYLAAGIFIPDVNSLFALDILRGDHGASRDGGALVFTLADGAETATSPIYSSLPLLAASTHTGRSKLRL